MWLDHFGTWSLLVALSLATIAESGLYDNESREERQAGTNFECKEEGYHADPQDCKIYYRCVDWGNSGPLTKFKFECAPGTVYSKPRGDICTHPNESERKECGGSGDESDNSNDVDSNNTYGPEKEKPHGKPESRPPSPLYGPSSPPSYGLPSPSYGPLSSASPSYGSSSSASPSQRPSYGSSTRGSTAGSKPSSVWASSTESIGQVPNESSSGPQCQRDGFMEDSKDCSKFYRCVDEGKGSFRRHEFRCGVGTVWDPKIAACNHVWAANRVGCKVSADSNPSSGLAGGNGSNGGHQPDPDNPNSGSPPAPCQTETPPVAGEQQGHPGNVAGYPNPSEGTVPNPQELEGTQQGPSPSSPPDPDYGSHQLGSSNPQGSSSSSPPTDPDNGSEQSQAPSQTQGPSSSNGGTCSSEGFFGNPEDCRKFYRCVSSGGKYVKYDFECGEGTVWDDRIESCNHLYAVPKCNGGTTGTVDNSATPGSQQPDVGSNEIGTSDTSESSSLEGSNGSGEPPVPITASSQVTEASSQDPSTSASSQDSSTQASTSSSEESSSSATETSQVTEDQNVSSSTPTPTPTYLPAATPQGPPASSVGSLSNGECSAEGFVSDPQNCKKFYRCVGNNGKYVKYEFECGEGTVWDDKIQSCNHAYAVPGCGGDSTTTQAELPSEGSPGGPSSGGSPGTPPSESSSGTPPSEGSPGTPPSESSPGSQEETSSESSPTTPPSEGSSAAPPSDSSSVTPPSDGSSITPPSEGSAEPQEETQTSSSPDESSSTGGPTSEAPSSEQPTTSDSNDSTSPSDIPPVSNTSASPNEETEVPASTESSETPEQTPLEGSSTTSAPSESSEATTAAGSEVASSESSKPSESGQRPGNQPAVSSSSKCQEPGFFPNKNDCTKFYRCVGGGPSSYTKYEFSCAPGTAWDQKILTCNHIDQVTSCKADGNNEIANEKEENEQTSSSSSTESSETGSSSSPTSTGNTSGTGGPSSASPVNMIASSDSTSESSSSSSSSSASTSEESSETGSTPRPCDTPKPSDGSNNGIVCNKEGFNAHPRYCDKFYRCVSNGNGFNVYYFDCPPGTIFDPSISVCNYRESVYPARDCEGGPGGDSSGTTTEASSRPPPASTPSGENTSSDGPEVSEPTTKPGEETTSEETTNGTAEEITSGNAEETTSGTSDETTTGSSEVTTDNAESSVGNEGTTTQEESTTAEVASSTEGETESSGTTTSTEAQEETTSAEEKPSTPEQESTESSAGTTGEPEQPNESTTSGETSQETTTGSSETSVTTPCPLGNLTGEQIVLVCPTGFKRHPKYCNIFYQCMSESNMDVKILTFTCPEGTIFDDEKIQCLAESDSSQPCTGVKAGARFYRRIESTSTSLMRVEQQETLCPGVGHYPYREGCSNVFYKCKRDTREALQGYLYKCPENFVYWSVSRRCERAARLPMCSNVSYKTQNDNNTWNSRWQLPVEDYNLSARMLHYR